MVVIGSSFPWSLTSGSAPSRKRGRGPERGRGVKKVKGVDGEKKQNARI
jgi:hypothetical protein